MTHLPDLVHDLALILITAGVVTVLFKWLKQPLVLGYIVAGFLVGPHVQLIPTVIDSENISVWSEIGIIFLLFALGLEFRLKKLIKVGKPALVAALINMGLMILLGYFVGSLMGWNAMESLFLGGMISMASTTIIIKAFNDTGQQNKRFANIVFGILIIEDIAAILMMVLFSTIAVSRTFEGLQLAESMFKLVFFIIIWFTVGIYIIPSALKRLKAYMNDETLLVASVGLCLGMVLFAHAVGFSAALGAFIMGSIFAETIESKKIERLIDPLRNLFGAVFFVSVGMMIIPEMIVEHIVPILILTFVVLVGRIIFGTLGVLAPGESLKTSMQAGFSLAQIGEFSFIIATLGIKLGVINEFVYPVIVAVSVITTFTTPYGIRYAEPLYHKLEKIIPQKWSKILVDRNKSASSTNVWGQFLQKFFTPVGIYSVMTLAVVLLAKMLWIPFITDKVGGILGNILAAIATVILMMPFLYGLIKRRRNIISLYFKLMFFKSWTHRILLPLSILPRLIAIALILMALMPLFPDAQVTLIMISIVALLFISANPWLEYQSEKIEQTFLENMDIAQGDDNHVFAPIPDGNEHLIMSFMLRYIRRFRSRWTEMSVTERKALINRRKEEWASMSPKARSSFFERWHSMNHTERAKLWFDNEHNIQDNKE
ncbi:MAG: cation:proton antiporter [Prevotellaceae bacterium]|jgi:CPA2 family monovalent cation:H+ antiporter-2|nr:cation:proton antiporter [Prevotellaceae bacterium]